MQTNGLSLLSVRIEDEMTAGKVYLRYPLGAMQYLLSSPYHGNLMLRYGLGEFAYWTLYPRFRVSMDGRYEELYSRAQFIRNFQFFDDQNRNPDVKGPLHALRQSSADFILTENTMPTTPALLKDPDWKLLYVDSYYALFGRISTLQHFPRYQPNRPFLTIKNMTLKDTLGDLHRFHLAPVKFQ